MNSNFATGLMCGAPECDERDYNEDDLFENQNSWYLYMQEEIRKRQMLADLHDRMQSYIQHQREEGKI